jgi:hypothetical protein
LIWCSNHRATNFIDFLAYNALYWPNLCSRLIFTSTCFQLSHMFKFIDAFIWTKKRKKSLKFITTPELQNSFFLFYFDDDEKLCLSLVIQTIFRVINHKWFRGKAEMRWMSHERATRLTISSSFKGGINFIGKLLVSISPTSSSFIHGDISRLMLAFHTEKQHCAIYFPFILIRNPFIITKEKCFDHCFHSLVLDKNP